MVTKFDPRRVAARILSDLESRTAFAEPLLDSALSRTEADPRDRGLCTTLVYGVLRMRIRLDRFLAMASGREIAEIDAKVLALLRVGAYQLLFMERVPKRAAVDTSVKAAKEMGLGHASGFVNAVLRRVSEGKTPQPPSDEAGRIAYEHSVEPWLASRWLSEFGAEGAANLAALSSAEPPLYLRLDTRKSSRRELLESLALVRDAGPGAFAPDSVWVKGGGDPRSLELVAKGLALVQGQASQLVAPMLEPKTGQRFLDACAAPGMKTFHLASLLGPEGEVVALDIHEHKVRRLSETAARLGFSNVKPRQADATVFNDGSGFDGALVDAPCTGLGVLARNPERKWRLDPMDPVRLAETQMAILTNVARLVKPDGVLVYATCTTTGEENEGVVRDFLAANREWSEDPAPLPAGVADGAGRLKTYPRSWGGESGDHLDGFFATRFRRRRA